MVVLPQDLVKPRDPGSAFFNRSKLWQAPRQQRLARCLSHLRALWSFWCQISWLHGFTRSCGKIAVYLVNRGPEMLGGSACLQMDVNVWTKWWNRKVCVFLTRLNFAEISAFLKKWPVTKHNYRPQSTVLSCQKGLKGILETSCNYIFIFFDFVKNIFIKPHSWEWFRTATVPLIMAHW